MKKGITLLGLVLVLASCAVNGKRISRITLGMSKEQVLNELGQPRRGIARRNNVEVLHYAGDGYFFVRLVDGKVESVGPETRTEIVTDTKPPITIK